MSGLEHRSVEISCSELYVLIFESCNKFAVFYLIFIQNSTENTVNILNVPSHKIWTMEIPVAMPSVTLCPCGNA